jgi:hypothetical protein
MAFNWVKHYEDELERLANEGIVGNEAEKIATQFADNMYWERVDQGRQEAKDEPKKQRYDGGPDC